MDLKNIGHCNINTGAKELLLYISHNTNNNITKTYGGRHFIKQIYKEQYIKCIHLAL